MWGPDQAYNKFSALLSYIAVTGSITAMKTQMKSQRKANQRSTRGIRTSWQLLNTALHHPLEYNEWFMVRNVLSGEKPNLLKYWLVSWVFHRKQTEYKNRSPESDIGVMMIFQSRSQLDWFKIHTRSTTKRNDLDLATYLSHLAYMFS